MSYENKPLTGVLFMREPTGNQPDFKGSIVLADGVEVELAGWFAKDRSNGQRRKDKHGRPWINLKLGDKREREERPAPQPPGDDDSCPF